MHKEPTHRGLYTICLYTRGLYVRGLYTIQETYVRLWWTYAQLGYMGLHMHCLVEKENVCRQ